MKEKPILFSGPMIRAILSGSKTQTRRVVKLPSQKMDYTPWQHPQYGLITAWSDKRGGLNVYCPYGKRGDRLWVRETHAIVPATAYRMSPGVAYRVSPDGHSWAVYREGWDRCQPGDWKPSIHMPRWASRLTLEICSVRVQRLQEISAEDAIAEGLVCEPEDISVRFGAEPGKMTNRTPVAAFARLWDSLNKARGYGWQSNPYVWAIEFRRLEA